MFYRRKLLISLLSQLGGKASSTDFQKLLFLVARRQAEPSYDFVPYRYGCFSFQSYADKRKLVAGGVLEDSEDWRLLSSGEDYRKELLGRDREAIAVVGRSAPRGDELVSAVYREFPYYAIRSEIAARVLNAEELAVVERHRPRKKETALLTVGYEGLSLDAFLNRLIQADVRVLCDVRKNALSRKYGFSKRTLHNAAESVGITYVHIPELGILSQDRKSLKTLADYRKLFDRYKRTTLKEAEESVDQIVELLKKHRRVALMCYERDPKMCHRSCVAEAVNAKAELKPVNL